MIFSFPLRQIGFDDPFQALKNLTFGFSTPLCQSNLDSLLCVSYGFYAYLLANKSTGCLLKFSLQINIFFSACTSQILRGTCIILSGDPMSVKLQERQL